MGWTQGPGLHAPHPAVEAAWVLGAAQSPRVLSVVRLGRVPSCLMVRVEDIAQWRACSADPGERAALALGQGPLA